MGAEYERKYRASRESQNAVKEDFPDRWESIAMQTTYFDTPSGSLSAKRYMLRLRKENGISVCTLKTKGTGNERGEWETPCDNITAAVPVLCKLGCPADLAALAEEGLVSICGAEFIRQAQTLETPDFAAELALDQGMLFSAEKQLPLCEIEIELKSGSKEAMDAFAESFAAKYGLAAEEKSKFARALSLYKEV